MSYMKFEAKLTKLHLQDYLDVEYKIGLLWRAYMYVFRNAIEEDAKGLARLRQKVWSENYRGIFHDEMIDNFDFDMHELKFLNQINDPEIEMFIIENDGNQIGYFSFNTTAQESMGMFGLRLISLYILYEYQNKGIGTKIFSHIRKYCSDKNILNFYNTCNMYNFNAIEFYKKMGGIVIFEDSGHENKFENQVYLEYIV